MSEENKTQTEEIKPEITAETIAKFAEENNQVLISRQDFARVMEGEEPENVMLKKAFSKLATNKHGEVSKKVKTDIENYFAEKTGIEKKEGESVFDYIARGAEALKLSGKDAETYKEALSAKQKKISDLESQLTEFSKKQERTSFENEFKLSFEEEIAKYGDLNPKLKAKLFADIAGEVYNSREISEEGKEIYRKGKRIVDENANEYNRNSIIHAFMNDYGFELSTTKPTENKQKGAPTVKNSVIEKDDQDTRTAYQKAYDIVSKKTEGQVVNAFAFKKMVREEADKIRKNN